ncbi:hypothetical protein CDAR_569471 [Caerostris darwini]|uniref:Uncharacterized protein n=1 Tax=Caerostris darwini TaxID=1538125 RepID=A0AAV4TVH4_9ARAC|nr:hypothetical protein CDAR_569471 [Caerostris darwini]
MPSWFRDGCSTSYCTSDKDHLALDQRALYATNSTNTTSPTSEFHQGKWITFQRYYPLLNNETSQDG